MGAFFNTIIGSAVKFLSSGVRRNVLFIGLLALTAFAEFCILGLARRTFVFYTINDGVVVVEDRMLKHSPSREVDIIRYTEETLLGPVSPDLLPLFPGGTRLKSLLYRNGIVYVDFSQDAALVPVEGGEALENFRTFYDGVLRNFSYVRDVRFFIEGTAAYVGGFLQSEIIPPEDFS